MVTRRIPALVEQTGFESGFGVLSKLVLGKQSLQLDGLHFSCSEEIDANPLTLFHQCRECVVPFPSFFKTLDDFGFITDRYASHFQRLDELRGFSIRIADHGVLVVF